MIDEAQLREFKSQWRELELNVVGMVRAEDGSWAAAEGMDTPPVAYDAILIGRNPSQDRFDILDLAEDVPRNQAVKAAKQAAKLLKISVQNIVIR